MRYRFGSIAIFVAIVLVNGCNHSSEPENKTALTTIPPAPPVGLLKVKDNTPPRLAVDKTTYDFQKMDQFKLGSHIFEVRNEGKGELFLRIQHTSCGCTSVKLGDVEWDPKHPAPKNIVTVLPGGKIDVELDWDTGE